MKIVGQKLVYFIFLFIIVSYQSQFFRVFLLGYWSSKSNLFIFLNPLFNINFHLSKDMGKKKILGYFYLMLSAISYHHKTTVSSHDNLKVCASLTSSLYPSNSSSRLSGCIGLPITGSTP